MTPEQTKLLNDLDAVLMKHGVYWQDAFPVIAECADEQCIGETDAVAEAFAKAAKYLRWASKAIKRVI